MWWVGWVFTNLLLGGAVLFSYWIVFGNRFGNFALPEGDNGYLSSPFWVGIDRNHTQAILFFQIAGIAGYVTWFASLLSERPKEGVLKETSWVVGSTFLFLLPSIGWPFLTYQFLITGKRAWGVLSSACLWVAAFGVGIMFVGTLEDKRDSPLALVGILLTTTVVCVVDGVGWTFMALK